MGLEVTTTINGLNPSWPTGSDSGRSGDDHLRMIKAVLKTMFPGRTGQGLSEPLLATEAEFNYLVGLEGRINAAIAAAAMPAGVIQPFYNAAPPPGWTLYPVSTSYMLTVGTAQTGGSGDPISYSGVAAHTHPASGGGGQTETAGEHTHGFSPTQVVNPDAMGQGNIYGGVGAVTISAITMQPSGGHSHGLAGLTIGVNDGAANFTPRYLGLILCQKS